MYYKPEGRGFIRDGVNGIFHYGPGFDPPLAEMSTMSITLGLRRPVRRADSLTTFMCRLSRNV